MMIDFTLQEIRTMKKIIKNVLLFLQYAAEFYYASKRLEKLYLHKGEHSL